MKSLIKIEQPMLARTTHLLRAATSQSYIDELWAKKGDLVYWYANKMVKGNLVDMVEELAHDAFRCAVRWWDGYSGSFNYAIKMMIRRVIHRELERRSRLKRKADQVSLTAIDGDDNNVNMDIPYKDKAIATLEFIDSLNELPEFERGLAEFCINNAHKYPLQKRRHGDIRAGEKQGIVYDYCGGNVWTARRVKQNMKAWLSGKSPSEFQTAGRYKVRGRPKENKQWKIGNRYLKETTA